MGTPVYPDPKCGPSTRDWRKGVQYKQFFLSRLVSLYLDGCSRLDQISVANLVNRVAQLQELDLSLKYTDLRARHYL